MATETHLKPDDEMRLLCKMVLEAQYDDFPDQVVKRAKQAILDTLAVTIGGSAQEGINAVVELVKDRGGRPDSYLPFYGGKVPASEAALALGPMARALDFGDINLVAGHCSEFILPSLLAVAGLKKTVSGKEFITAFIVGSEVLIRTGLVTRLDKALSNRQVGGHYIFGCVAAVGKLLDLNQEELENAQGIASSMTQPHSLLLYVPSTLMIRVHHGFVCQDAVNACFLARKGITGPRNGVLSCPAGYAGFIRWESSLDLVTKDLGIDWGITKLTAKRYPIVGSALTPIDGLLRQMDEFHFKANDIEKIHIEIEEAFSIHVISPNAQGKQWNPQSEHDAQFSLPYGVAIAAFTGDVFLDAFSEENRSRHDIRDLMKRISVAGNPSLSRYAAKITTTLKNDKQYTSEYMYPKGHYEYPMDDADMIEKFKKCASYSVSPIPSSVADSVGNTILAIEAVDDVVSAIVAPLTPK